MDLMKLNQGPFHCRRAEMNWARNSFPCLLHCLRQGSRFQIDLLTRNRSETETQKQPNGHAMAVESQSVVAGNRAEVLHSDLDEFAPRANDRKWACSDRFSSQNLSW